MLDVLYSFWSDYFALVRWFDVVDILFVALLIYQAFLLLKGTRALQIFIGLSLVFILYWMADRFELRTLRSVLGSVFQDWILILILLFHQDIRRALSKVGRASFFKAPTKFEQGQMLEELIRGLTSLANKKIGALVVLEREADISEFIEAGVQMDCRLSKEALSSIFMPVSPLHDGAAIVREGRISTAGCFLPLSLNPLVSRTMGTRHRAALGITEETDAICIVVSEEKGSLSFAVSGKITHDIDSAQLRKMLSELISE